MKIIETLTRHRFSAKATKIGDEALFCGLAFLTLVFLCLPWVLLYLRF